MVRVLLRFSQIVTVGGRIRHISKEQRKLRLILIIFRNRLSAQCGFRFLALVHCICASSRYDYQHHAIRTDRSVRNVGLFIRDSETLITLIAASCSV